MMADPHTELMDVIAGRGKFHCFGTGITTWPTGDDNNKKIHAGCLELERRGLIHRQDDAATRVLWMPGATET